MQPLVKAFDSVATHQYLNGPLLAIAPPKRRSKKLSRKERDAAAAFGGQPDPVAVAAFAGDVSPWRPDKTVARRPKRGDMEGALAVVAGMFHSGRVVISSTHPEFSGDAGILEEMCLWAAGR